MQCGLCMRIIIIFYFFDLLGEARGVMCEPKGIVKKKKKIMSLRSEDQVGTFGKMMTKLALVRY